MGDEQERAGTEQRAMRKEERIFVLPGGISVLGVRTTCFLRKSN